MAQKCEDEHTLKMKLEATARALKEQQCIVSVLSDELDLSESELDYKVQLEKAKKSEFESLLKGMSSISKTTATLTESLSLAISSATRKNSRKRNRNNKSALNRRERRRMRFAADNDT